MSWLEEFKAFIQRGNVIDLAVAVIIGAAFTNTVNSMVNDVFTPVLGIVTSGPDAFSGLDIRLYGDAKIKTGALLKAIINFFVIAFCVFLIVKVVNVLHLKKLAGAQKAVELTPQEKLLTEIRDLLKAQQAPAPPVSAAEQPRPV